MHQNQIYALENFSNMEKRLIDWDTETYQVTKIESIHTVR